MTYIYDTWYRWDKSIDIIYESRKKGIGDGEEKVAKELNGIIGGQNRSWDIEKDKIKFEVKKLDADNSGRLGVEIQEKYQHIKFALLTVLKSVEKLKDLSDFKIDFSKIYQQIWTNSHKYHKKTIPENLENLQVKDLIKICDENGLLKKGNKSQIIDRLRNPSKNDFAQRFSIYQAINRDEVSAQNLYQLDLIIQKLNQMLLKRSDFTPILHCSLTGEPKKYPLISAYHKLKSENISKPRLIQILGGYDNYNLCIVIDTLSTSMEFFNKRTLKQQLNELVRTIFNRKQLILVDKAKGFMMINDPNRIYCNRITSGSPRFKLKQVIKLKVVE